MKCKILLFIGIIVVYGCSPKLSVPFERTGAVEFVKGEKNTITLSSTSTAGKAQDLTYYCERNALENLLFRGIPGSNQENPMIENESVAYAGGKGALDDLILRDGYRKFLIQSYKEDEYSSGKGTSRVQIVKFDLQAMRKHLESVGLVRKFGL